MAGKKLRIAVAPDSFKGSMTALAAAEAVECGLRRVLANLLVRKIPMADGGDGTVQAIIDATGGRFVRAAVHDPLGRAMSARYGLAAGGRTAVIEMAAASGLVLLRPSERNPLKTTTRGTGDLVRAALRRDAKKVLVGIGGSATNDGGMGMAHALGIRFLDARGRELPEGGGALGRLARIDASRRLAAIGRARIEVACDVDNPLTGPRGATRIYARQKGATAAMIRTLEANMKHFAQIVHRDLGIDVSGMPGAGAAGGLGAGLMAFLGAALRPGVDMVSDAIGLRRKLAGCDLVITGEGRTDGQTVFGKAPMGVLREARELGIPVVLIAGSTGEGVEALLDHGLQAYFSALPEPLDEEAIRERGPELLADCAAQVARAMTLNLPASRRRATSRSQS